MCECRLQQETAEKRKQDAATALQQRKADKRSRLTEEPAAGTAGTATIRIRLPDGTSAQRRFMADQPLQVHFCKPGIHSDLELWPNLSCCTTSNSLGVQSSHAAFVCCLAFVTCDDAFALDTLACTIYLSHGRSHHARLACQIVHSAQKRYSMLHCLFVRLLRCQWSCQTAVPHSRQQCWCSLDEFLLGSMAKRNHAAAFMIFDDYKSVLQVIYDFVDSLEGLTSLKYSLATTFPKVIYGSDQLQLSLSQLNLAPQAAMLVQPQDND